MQNPLADNFGGNLMGKLKLLALSYPISAFLLLCFGITWAVWFSVPAIAGSNWAFGKIIVGAGFGPALAAIILAQLNGTGNIKCSAKWWLWFAAVFSIMCLIYASILLTGDAITAKAYETAQPVGVSLASVLSCIVSAAVASFIVACLVCSADNRLNAILKWRVPLIYWCVALLLPASWMLAGLMTANLLQSPVQAISGNLPVLTHAAYILRSVVFTFLVVAIGEEAGWRAWLLPALQKRFNPLLSSFFLGLVWGAWHFPLFVIGQYSAAPLATFAKMGACVILATLFTWLFNRSGNSLLLAVLLHTALNNTPRLIPLTEQMALFFIAVLIAVIFYDRMWKRQNMPAAADSMPAKT
jgi:uncharacterized protein